MWRKCEAAYGENESFHTAAHLDSFPPGSHAPSPSPSTCRGDAATAVTFTVPAHLTDTRHPKARPQSAPSLPGRRGTANRLTWWPRPPAIRRDPPRAAERAGASSGRDVATRSRLARDRRGGGLAPDRLHYTGIRRRLPEARTPGVGSGGQRSKNTHSVSDAASSEFVSACFCVNICYQD